MEQKIKKAGVYWRLFWLEAKLSLALAVALEFWSQIFTCRMLIWLSGIFFLAPKLFWTIFSKDPKMDLRISGPQDLRISGCLDLRISGLRISGF